MTVVKNISMKSSEVDTVPEILEVTQPALYSEKEKFELLASRTLDGLVLCTSEYKILFINNSAKRLLGFDIEKNLEGAFLTEFGVEFLLELLEEAKKNNLNEFNKVIDLRSDYSILIGVHLELLKTPKNEHIGWMYVLRDVTNNWQSDQMRSALMVASHEIKTPLNSMLGAIDLLLERDLGDLDHKQQHCLEIVKDDIQRLNRLLADILDLSRFDEGVQFLERRKNTSLIFLVNKVFDSFQSYAKTKNISLKNKIPKSLPTFKGDRDRLQQVLSNLVENAIKYSLPKSEISIDAKLEDLVIECCVTDNGIGIPEEEQENIFERFKRLDHSEEQTQCGYGLGLSIAKEITEALGGRIWVESKLGGGSKFYFTVPV